MDEKPAWLDEKMEAKIPPDMIPSKEKIKCIAAKREVGVKPLSSMSEINIMSQEIRN